MSDDRSLKAAKAETWRPPANYLPLINADRRSWLGMASAPSALSGGMATANAAAIGLRTGFANVDTERSVPDARPIWMSDLDGQVRDSRAVANRGALD